MKVAGWVLTALVALFLFMDSGMKIAGARASVEATTSLGFAADQVPLLGWILLVSALLYCLPQTSMLGAVLVTAYLGGAVAINLQHHTPLVSHLMFGVYLGVLLWGGLLLRSPALRSLMPWSTSSLRS